MLFKLLFVIHVRNQEFAESVQWPLIDESVIAKYRSWRQEEVTHQKTINDVKEVADDRVKVVRDLNTDSVITTWLLLRDDQKMQVSATAEETSRLSNPYSEIRSLHLKISNYILSQICTKGRPCFSDRSTKELSLYCSLHTMPAPKAYWFLTNPNRSTSMGGIK